MMNSDMKWLKIAYTQTVHTPTTEPDTVMGRVMTTRL
jgi:hypothetical protein